MKRFLFRAIINTSSVTKSPEMISDGQKAYARIVELYSAREYYQVLNLIEEVNKKYPELVEATRYYKGKASIRILDEEKTTTTGKKV
jgi:hypothetical protein